MAISPFIWVIVILLITLLVTTHKPPSRLPNPKPCFLRFLPARIQISLAA